MTSPIDNEDLISILSKGSDTNDDTKESDNTIDVECSVNDTEDVEEESSGLVSSKKKNGSSVQSSLSNLATAIEVLNRKNEDTENTFKGSGDVGTDLSRWIDGKDLTPSDDLNRYVSSSDVKFKYGLSHSTMNNFDLMTKLKKFLDGANEMLFNEEAVLNLSPYELENRVRTAFTRYAELAKIDQRTVLALEQQRRRYNDGTSEVDKLALLLSSVPTEKLKDILTAVQKMEG